MNGEQSANGARTLPDDAVVVVPVSNVIFPGVVFPIVLDRPSAVAAAQQALREQHPLVLVLQQDVQAPDPGPQSLHRMGTLANVLRYVTGPDGAPHVACQGVERFEIDEWVEGFPFLVARGRRIPEPEAEGAAIEARFLHLRSQALEALQLLPQSPPGELVAAVEGASSPAALADLVAAYLDLQPPEKQQILETIDLEARLDKVSAFLAQRLEVLRLTSEIAQRTRQSLGERQRETLLREQMAAIQRELGEGEREELVELEAAIENAGMPEEVVQQARKELRRLARTPEAAAEYGMVRTYLEWLVELPWGVPEAAPIDLAEARRILDEDHFGLEKIKQRIIEHLAVRRLAPEGKAPILCFVGPPGVGKTSLGQSIARAMHRPFVRVSLGGVHDESEIRGHRRTYVGALPGNIIQAIRKAGRRDCVMMLDEIDKMSAGIHGDPSAALLEVLDPEQNVAFRDNYLAVPFDLSRVVFIATANMLDTIPGPLRDRMEVIQLSGYTAGEKRQIAERYLVRRQLEANGLTAEQVQIEPAALETLIARYTREAGVRSLEREIGRLLRHVAVRFAEGHTEPVRIGPTNLEPILGPPRVENEVAMRTSVPGVATGLAWTPVGGEILFIEATRTPGDGRLILTGQLGEVMRESAQTALSLVKSRAEALGVTPSLFKESDIHIHVPAGATPKDGPSAGVAMTMALISLLTDRTVRSDTAMTGEISLRGLVLPVGGIKEKVVAAATAGVRRVLLPARNRADERDIPEETRQTLELIWLERIEDAIEAGLDPRRGDVRQTQVRAAS
ncbi:ATP-dependent protease LA (plasmid) [Phenylobacterium zucineum HLK1]|uniref:Lon protease n=1 Tax=Phenylobacterium zucineum (strain HLK1) TaxID=450851 RepID=LON_PHEZH|nr:endopeptidase La [Phenylobacterium zucineum]B4RI01.1 RecName: Full=Lon protease; AltName: Full=ATP-dependent protease La [Phenylobacterium zucineum HLK1]ACG79976.1 ATP-dependent protease LA [Phenylobacterium zucineum HLK1]